MDERKTLTLAAKGSTIESATRDLKRRIGRLLERDNGYSYKLVSSSETEFQKEEKDYVAYQTIVYERYSQIHVLSKTQ